MGVAATVTGILLAGSRAHDPAIVPPAALGPVGVAAGVTCALA